MLREGVAAGHIPPAETAIVEMALRLGDRRVSAVMTPRTQIEFLDLDDPRGGTAAADPRQRLFALSGGAAAASHQLAGIVQDKDLLAACLAGEPFDLRPALRPPLFLPNTVTRAARARNVQEQRRADGAGRRRIRRPRRAGHA